MKNAILKILFAIILVSMYSCATFERGYKKIDKQKITAQNISLINGTYPIYPVAEINDKVKKDTILQNEKTFRNIYSELTNNNKKLDSEYTFTLNSIDNYVSFSLLKGDTIIESKKIKVKIKRNGFVYLKNTKTGFNGIPYLFGGSNQVRTRLGLSNNGELIVNKAYDATGAFLFFFWAGYAYNTCNFYKVQTDK